MTHTRRFSALALVVLVASLFALPAGAVLLTQSEEPAVEEAPAVEYDGPDAFIPVEETVETPFVNAWTYRYLIPTAILLTIVLIAATVVMYFVRVVRTRYTVAE